ncbi:MAG: hypothetical protein ABIP58_04465, partial [Dehalococcoidia bacterium]
FAKVLVGKETKAHAQQLADTGVRAGAMVNTDGSWSFRNVTGVDVDYQVVSGDRAGCERWLPWVHKFISNAKEPVAQTHDRAVWYPERASRCAMPGLFLLTP